MKLPVTYAVGLQVEPMYRAAPWVPTATRWPTQPIGRPRTRRGDRGSLGPVPDGFGVRRPARLAPCPERAAWGYYVVCGTGRYWLRTEETRESPWR